MAERKDKNNIIGKAGEENGIVIASDSVAIPIIDSRR
jgi:hypothetical protein